MGASSGSSSASAAISSARVSGVIDSQSSPTLTSTMSGTDSGSAPSIVSRTSAASGVDLVARHLEQQLVVDRQEQPRARAGRRQALGDPDHRDLLDVGRGALDGHVDGHPLPRPAQRRVGRAQLRDLALAPEQRLDPALGLGLLLDRHHVVADARSRPRSSC